MKGCIHIVRGMTKKLTLPGSSVTIKSDSTIWCQGMPLLGITDPDAKAKAVAAVKAKRYADIPDEYFTRMGDNPNGLWAGDDEAWNNHPAKIAENKAREIKAIEQAKRVTIYLSSRGWGDYSPCEWIGDITRPDVEILAECKAELAGGHDVDEHRQSDEQILSKITAARAKWEGAPARDAARAKAEKEDIERKKATGYCFNCETWCDGDCGHYSSDPTVKFRRDLHEAQREQNYGVED